MEATLAWCTKLCSGHVRFKSRSQAAVICQSCATCMCAHFMASLALTTTCTGMAPVCCWLSTPYV